MVASYSAQPLMQEQIAHARKPIDKGEARQYVADLLNVGRSTLYRALSSLTETYFMP